MKRSLVVLLAMSCFCVQADITEFTSGTVLTAEDLNSNFSHIETTNKNINDVISAKSQLIEANTLIILELQAKIALLEGAQSFKPNGLANNIPAKISATQIGAYSIEFENKITMKVDHEGNGFTTSHLYFENSDCSGSAYLKAGYPSYTSEVGDTFLNPVLSLEDFATLDQKQSSVYHHYDGLHFYAPSDTLVKLNFKAKVGYGGPGCYESEGTIIATRALQQTFTISTPVIITGIGKPMVITEEIGDAP